MGNPTVFVVDADLDSLDRLHDILTDAGFNPILWWEATRAHDLVREVQPLLVLLERDLERPGEGLDVLAELRADPATSRIPVTLIARDVGTPAGVMESRNGPLPRMLVKPLEASELVEVVEDALASRMVFPGARSRPTASPAPDDIAGVGRRLTLRRTGNG
ncbi:MAG TPA: hypothetical protein VMU89_20890 [Thermomicrobiaceae bacterium]|nr:hypothetical protein [Thermomicrobiaceae bacterium]